MELILVVSTNTQPDVYEFQVYQQFVNLEQRFKDSILKLNYEYTPWPRFDGNLLWS